MIILVVKYNIFFHFVQFSLKLISLFHLSYKLYSE